MANNQIWSVPLPFNNITFNAVIKKSLISSSKLRTIGIFPMTVVEYVSLNSVIQKNMMLSTPIKRVISFSAKIEGF